MKRIVFAAVMIVGLTATGFSQKKGDIEAGINIGYNVSSVSDEYGQSDSGNGFNFGGSLDYYFSDAWSIKAKLIYDQKGWNNDYIEDVNGDIYPTNVNVDYLTVPLMANWHFGAKRNWYLNFGPYIGFLLDAKETRFDTDVTDAFNSTDFGLAAGIGVKLPLTNKLKLFFELDGQGGFTDIFKESDYSAVTNSRTAFNVGLNFLLK